MHVYIYVFMELSMFFLCLCVYLCMNKFVNSYLKDL